MSPCHSGLPLPLAIGDPTKVTGLLSAAPPAPRCHMLTMLREKRECRSSDTVTGPGTGMQPKQNPESHFMKTDVTEVLDPRNRVNYRGWEPPFLLSGTGLRTKPG